MQYATSLLIDEEHLAAYNGIQMRVGLLSDTHIPIAERALPSVIMEAFRGVDLILHAGDIYATSVLDELECIAPVLAARGDDDEGPEIERDQRVKERHILNLNDNTLWLVHARSYFILKEIKEMTTCTDQEGLDIPNIVVYGHLHQPSINHDNGILYINPGSPTFLDYRNGLGTVGILTIDSGRVEADIVWL